MKLKCFFIIAFVIFLYSCSVSKQINKSARQDVIDAAALQTAHVGISIYEPATGKYLYNYQGDKYFVPASNTKLPTCYAAMKYLGDSLVGAKVLEYGNDLIIFPSGDPTFLNDDFKYQPLLSFLKSKNNSIVVRYGAWQDYKWGSGWAWNDYQETYMAERSPMPVYGNVVKLIDITDSAMSVFGNADTATYITYPKFFSQKRFWDKYKYYTGDIAKELTVQEIKSRSKAGKEIGFIAGREVGGNIFYVKPSFSYEKIQSMSFVASSLTINQLLQDTLHKKIVNENIYFTGDERLKLNERKTIHSQPTDSLLKPMMHRSDNFFAEQTLLMVSNEMLGVMNDAKIIDTLLKTDFKDLPQKPHWVDGSGLSRYDLFSPQDFVFILNKMRTDFGIERIKNILATGNTGTLTNYYKAESGFIFAKTGTLSGVVALSGFLYTKKNKLLIFSVLVNNHQSSATDVRRSVEKFIENVRNNY